MSKEKKEKSAVYNILAFTFDGKDDASEAVKAIKKSGALAGQAIVAQAVVEQDEKGKVHIHEPGMGGIGSTVGAVGGGLLGLIGGPAGLLAWTVGGAVVGGAMTPDSSAFLLLVEDIDSEKVVDSMQGYSANVVTLTVGDELSGQIAAYVAGEAHDDQGNVVAGAGGVAAG
jgi:uncharacterized membrane protein